jgi:hypothetical protein
VPTEKDLATTQEQLIKLLRLSPTLTTVVEHDPTLLSNLEYVNRNNPQLCQFLQFHPEIGRNPEFYLFSKLKDGGSPDERLERAVWPDLVPPQRDTPMGERFMNDLEPVLAFACVMGVFIWLTRLFVENRRWGRIFKLQMEAHGKLLDKFAAPELLAYMETEAGRRFLEAAPIPVFNREERVPSAVARVLTPLQIGVVLTLLGLGFFFLSHTFVEIAKPMLVLGTVFLMTGLGFIISAGLSWKLASRLGLMPLPADSQKPIESSLQPREEK